MLRVSAPAYLMTTPEEAMATNKLPMLSKSTAIQETVKHGGSPGSHRSTWACRARAKSWMHAVLDAHESSTKAMKRPQYIECAAACASSIAGLGS
jgi:hypothetical protein